MASRVQVLCAGTEQSTLFILTTHPCTSSLSRHLVSTYYVPGSEDGMENNRSELKHFGVSNLEGGEEINTQNNNAK